MTIEAAFLHCGDAVQQAAGAARVAGEVIQLADGRASVTAVDTASGAIEEQLTEGIFIVQKTAGVCILDGQELWWDHSANTASYYHGNDRDFPIGVAVGDSLAAATTVKVALNVTQKPIISLTGPHSGWTSVIVKTVVGSTTVEVPNVIQKGGSCYLTHGATSEAQKVDMLSQRSFPIGSKWIAEFVFNVVANGATNTSDISIGIANATHASDADAITEHIFVHIDGNSTKLNLQSKDGTTTVAATDTTLTFTAGTPVHCVIDGRNMADIQVYINGALALDSTVFNLGAAAGPLYALVHMEKSAQTDVAALRIDKANVRIMQQQNS